MKTLILSLLFLLCSCSSADKGGKSISAPKEMLPAAQHHVLSIEECWRKSKVPDVRPHRKPLKIKTQVATSGKTVPIFVYGGQRVGGYQIGDCGIGSTIVIGVFPNGRWDDRVLRHEICHHMDMQGPCLGGHKLKLAMGGCCPFWPYITVSSYEAPLEDGTLSVRVGEADGGFITSVERETSDGFECVFLYDEALVSASEVGAKTLDEDWWVGLRKIAESP